MAGVSLQLANALLAFLLAVVLARVLGPAGYGTYAYVFSLATLLAIAAQIGLPQLIVRETAKAQTYQEWGLMRGLWRWVTVVSLSSSLLLALATAGVAWLIAERMDTAQLMTLVWGLLLVPLIALGNLRGAALRGLGRILQGQLPEFILRPALLIAFVSLPFWNTSSLTADQAMAFHVLAAFAAFVVGVWLLRLSRPAPLLSNHTIPVYQFRKWINSALPLAFVTGVYAINSQIDILMLGVFESAEEVGIYRVALQGAALVALGLNAMNLVVSPYFAELHARADFVRLQKVTTATGRVGLLLALPVVLVFLIFGKPILGHVFGPNYVSGYSALAILTLGQLGNAAFGHVAVLLNMTGHERVTARTVGLAAICNVLLNLTLIPVLGLNGAALSTGTTALFQSWLLWRSLRKQLGPASMAWSIKPQVAS